MIDRDLDLHALCSAIGGYTREYISAVINQRIYAPDVIKKINTYLQIDEYLENQTLDSGNMENKEEISNL